MDGVNTQIAYPACDMPRAAPLAMPVQDLSAPWRGRKLPEPEPTMAGRRWRIFVFAPALVTTLLIIWGVERELARSGLSVLEYMVLALTGSNFIWISLSVSTTTAGLLAFLLRKPSVAQAKAMPQSVAILVPIYNEVPCDVFGNALAMLRALARGPHPGRFTFFVLSDTQNAEAAALEWQAYCLFRAMAPPQIAVHYRRRGLNVDRKVGNLTDWITGWGAAHEAMLVLDADSLMDATAIWRLCDEMSRDPTVGLVQTCPRLIGARTLFARVQQFSNVAYGKLLGEGLALWSQTEGNYWGHNAIIRTRAFAETAGLPPLRGITGKERLILSHDFVEAGLMRRAGWKVRFVPEIAGSYEETPPSLVDYVLRDRRWCQGNLQHLLLLPTRGMKLMSRFHLLHGAVSYLLSPSWFAVLVIWALLGNGVDQNIISYFSAANPLRPNWPDMMNANGYLFLGFMYMMLLVPKIMGVLIITFTPLLRRQFGGLRQFLPAFLFEVVLSVAYAPVVMVQQTMAVLRSVVGIKIAWNPQRRDGTNYPLGVLVQFHAVETVIGGLLVAGMVAGLVSTLLAPIAASLVLAVPLSMISSYDLAGRAEGALRLETPQTLREPPIVTRAHQYRRTFAAALAAPPEQAPVDIAAE